MHTNTSCRRQYNATFPVLVVRVNTNTSERAELPENGTVSLTFNILEVCK